MASNGSFELEGVLTGKVSSSFNAMFDQARSQMRIFGKMSADMMSQMSKFGGVTSSNVFLPSAVAMKQDQERLRAFMAMQKQMFKEEDSTNKQRARSIEALERLRSRLAGTSQRDSINALKASLKAEEDMRKRSAAIYAAMKKDELAQFKKIEAEKIAVAKAQTQKQPVASQQISSLFTGKPLSSNGPPAGGDVTNTSMLASVVGFWGKIYGLIQAAKVLYYTAEAGLSFIGRMLKEGLEYNTLLQDSRLGIAGVLGSFANIVDAQKQLVPQAEKWNAALSISDRITQQLQVAAFKTKAVYSELARGIQEGLAPMLKARLGDEQLTPFVTRFIQTMTALRVPLREIGQEIRGIMAGDTNARTSRVANLLFQDWLLQGKNVKAELKKLFTEDGGFYSWFMKNTEFTGKAGEEMMRNYDGALTNLKEAWERNLGAGTQALWGSLTNEILRASDALLIFDDKGNATFNENLVDIVKKLSSALATIVDKAVTISINFLKPGGTYDTWREWFALMKRDFEEIGKPIVKTITVNYKKWFEGSDEIVKADSKYGDSQLHERKTTPSWDFLKYTGIAPSISVGDEGYQTRNPLSALTYYGLNKYNKWANNVDKDERPASNIFTSVSAGVAPSPVSKRFIGPRAPKFGIEPPVVAPEEPDEDAVNKVARKARQLRDQLDTIRKINRENTAMLQGNITLGVVGEAQKRLTESLLQLENERASKLNTINDLSAEALQKMKMTRDDLITSTNKAFDVEKITKVKQAITDLDEKMKHDHGFGSQEVEPFMAKQTIYVQKMIDDAAEKRKKKEAKDAEEYAKKRNKLEEEAADKYWDQMQARADDFKEKFKLPVADYLSDFISTGGKNFGKMAGAAFNKATVEGVDVLLDKFLGVFAGVSEVKNDKGEVVGYKGKGSGEVWNTRDQAAANNPRTQKAMAGFEFAQIGFGSYANAQANPKGAQTAGALGGAASGALIGAKMLSILGPYGAVIGAILGAIVGWVGAAMGKADSRSQYKYGVFGVNAKGEAGVSSLKNIQAPERKAMLARVQDTFDEFWNGYVTLLLKFPNAVIPKLKAIDGKFQTEASANFLKHFEEWISGTLPDDIAIIFKGSMEKVYTGMGLSFGKFNELWKQFDKLDPKKALELWGIVADTLQKVSDAIDFFGGAMHTPEKSGGKRRAVGTRSNGLGTWEIQGAKIRDEKNSSFASIIAKEDKEIITFAKNLENLTGEAQIRAASQLGDMMIQRMEREKQFLQQLINMADEAQQTVRKSLEDLTAEGFKDAEGNPDNKAQAQYWKKLADDALLRMGSATNPDQLNTAWNDYLAYVGRAQQSQAAMGPKNAEEARKWAMESLRIGLEVFNQNIARLGTSINEINNKFLTEVQPYIDKFTGALDGTGTSIEHVRDEFDKLPDPIRKVREEFEDLYNVMRTGNANLATQGGGSSVSSMSAGQDGYELRTMRRRAAR